MTNLKPVDMAHMESGVPGSTPGDCFRCCVATILGLSRDEVPHFCDLPDPATLWVLRTQASFAWIDVSAGCRHTMVVSE
jgi:hypothetical protein